MNDLEQIHAVKRRKHALVALVVRCAVAQLIAHYPVVISAYHLSRKEKVRLKTVRLSAKSFYKLCIKAVSHIEPKPVYIKFINPALYAVYQVICNRGIF